MGEIVDLNPLFLLTEAPADVARAQRRLASQLGNNQAEQGDAQDRVLDRRTDARVARERLDADVQLRRTDDRVDSGSIQIRQEEQRARDAAENIRRVDDQRAFDRLAESRRLADAQRLADQIQQVDARVQDQRELERRRAAQLIVDQRIADQRLAAADFNALAERGAIVDLTA